MKVTRIRPITSDKPSFSILERIVCGEGGKAQGTVTHCRAFSILERIVCGEGGPSTAAWCSSMVLSVSSNGSCAVKARASHCHTLGGHDFQYPRTDRVR